MTPSLSKAAQRPSQVSSVVPFDADKQQAGAARAVSAQAEQHPFFSLILATYGRADVLQGIVQSLLQQSERSFEVIVVDQNADDRVEPYVSALRRAGVDVVRLKLPEPNLSGARNAGISVARGEFVAFPDDDCWYEADTLSHMKDALRANDGLDGAIAQWVEVAPEHGTVSDREVRLADWRRFRGGDASSITLFLRLRLVRDLGGFDPRIGVGRWYGAGEETDLLLRLLTVGARLSTARRARVRHAAPVRPRAVSVDLWQRKRVRERGVGAMYVKHRMSLWTVLRGLVAPVVRGMLGLEGRPSAACALYGLACVIGRIEGAVRWLFSERDDHRRSPKPADAR